jgi:hypothetical protein
MASPASKRSPAILSAYTAQEHRRRLENIGVCEKAIRSCLRKHLIRSYLPGQCTYNLCEYPAGLPWEPNDYDEKELDALRDEGIRLIQVHNEWRDELGIAGGDHFTSHNPKAFRRFVDMVHGRGMKIIPYVSTGFFDLRDAHWRSEWSRGGRHRATYWQLAMNSASSVGWRAYLLPNLVRLMDEYGVDGLYNDDSPFRNGNPTADEVLPFAQTDAQRKIRLHRGGGAADRVLPFTQGDPYAATYADLNALIYAEIKRRGGVYKIHAGNTTRPPTELTIYDYLWVGECCSNPDGVRDATKNYEPYVVPCVDFSASPNVENEDQIYRNSIPYMQFPLLQAGRPFTGERDNAPGLKYTHGYRNLRQAWEHYQAHPNGPHPAGWWDSVPGRPEMRPTYARWLKQYLPLVEEGTWAYLEIHDSDLFAAPMPKDVVASAFANRDLYLVLANYGQTSSEVATVNSFLPVADAGSAPSNRWTLPKRSLQILRKTG